jgi:hypothetical protein
MRNLIRFGAMAVAVLMVAAVVAPALASSEVTVGRFVQELARHKNLNATDVQIAVDSLRSVGIRLPEGMRLEARLTEGDVVNISRAAGLRVTTSNPNAPFDSEQVQSFLFALSDELVDDGGNTVRTTYPYGEGNGQGWGPQFDPFSKGKGKHKGHAKGWQSTTEPE